MNRNIYPAQTWQVVCAVSIYASAAARPALTVRRHRVTPNSCSGSAAIISERGRGVRGRQSTHVKCSDMHKRIFAFYFCFVCAKTKEQEAKLKVVSGRKLALALPRLQLTHIGIFFFYEMCGKVIFRPKKEKRKKTAASHLFPRSAKYFRLKNA